MTKRNVVNLHVYASQTVKKCMKPVMVHLKDVYKPNGFTVRFFNVLTE